jgi:hypothetical protein
MNCTIQNTTPAGSDVYRKNGKQRKYDPSRGRTFFPSCIFYKHAIPPGLIVTQYDITPTLERSYVYKIKRHNEASDPGRGRTFSPSCIFYKHIIPPGLNDNPLKP